MRPPDGAALVEALLGPCEAQLEAALDRLAVTRRTVEAGADRLGAAESTLTIVASAAPPARAMHAVSLPFAPASESVAEVSAPPTSLSEAASTAEHARPSPRRPWRGLVALLLAVGLVALSVVAQDDAGPPPAAILVVAEEPTVVRLQGELRLRRAGGGDATGIEGAATLQPSDRLETDGAGRAAITWPHGAVATLDPQAAVALAAPARDNVVRLQLNQGGLWMDGGAERGAPLVEAVAPDGARVVGRRFQAHRDAAGRLVVSTLDAPAEVSGLDSRQQLAPGSTSEVLPGRLPALPRPVTVPPAVALTVDGPPAWLLIDRFGRAVGAPPSGGPWLDQLPGVRGPLPRPRGAGVVVPEPQGEYRLILWAGDAARDYRMAVWPTNGQALFGGAAPRDDAAAVRFEGQMGAGTSLAATFVVQDRTVAARAAPRELDALPAQLRLAMAPADAPGGQPPVLPESSEALEGGAPDEGEPPDAPDAVGSGGAPTAAAPAATPTVTPTPPAAFTLRTPTPAPAVSPEATSATATPTPVEEAEPPPSPTATASPTATPSFSRSIPGVAPPPAATATATRPPSPTGTASPLLSVTPLTFARSPTPTLVPRVEAPALSGTVTVGTARSPGTASGTPTGGFGLAGGGLP